MLSGMLLVLWMYITPVAGQDAVKTLRVATEPTFPPFEMQSDKTGELEGFDIDLMNAVAKEVGYLVQFDSLPFDGIIPALQSGTIDAAISGITITAERARSIGFSSPYFKAGLAIAVREDNTTIKNFDDLKGKRIAVQIGTTGSKEAANIPGARIVTFDGAPSALQELVNGKVDAVVNDYPVTLYAIKTAGLRRIKIVGELVTEEYYGIAFPSNSPAIRDINFGLYKIVENGIYEGIFQKWFNNKPQQLPLIAPALVGAKADVSGITTGGGTRDTVFNLLLRRLPQGALVTLLLTAFSVFFGLIGGTLVAMGLISKNKILQWILRIYVEFFRGTPMLVQLFIIYFGLPGLFKEIGLQWSLERFPAAIIALSLNVAAYLAEIIRGGIQSIDPGQWEACQSLGMNSLETMKEVIFPQAFRRILPPLGNEFITLIKDTSLTAVIGFNELFRQGQLIVATTYQAFEVYIAVALVYLALTVLSSVMFKNIENFMDPIKRGKNKAKTA
ncbi:MAG: ABC transporter permease subunit [Chlorogloea purpurea SAG 13.99]|nr:ABC transporter permease subunit [Chlorogloea purpurea SAG 13.99]